MRRRKKKRGEEGSTTYRLHDSERVSLGIQSLVRFSLESCKHDVLAYLGIIGCPDEFHLRVLLVRPTEHHRMTHHVAHLCGLQIAQTDHLGIQHLVLRHEFHKAAYNLSRLGFS